MIHGEGTDFAFPSLLNLKTLVQCLAYSTDLFNKYPGYLLIPGSVIGAGDEAVTKTD